MSHMEQVKASAGSGKTHDITQRFLAFLAQSEIKPYAGHCALRKEPQHGETAQSGAWGDIMAITFTNSAAAEMKGRVLESLKTCALGKLQAGQTSPPMQAEKAKAWIDVILRQYGTLNIRTIDSLLHLIVRTAALDLGLDPDFESSFHTKEIMEPLFDALLEQAEQEEATMLSHLRAMCHSLLFRKDTQGFVMGSRMLDQLLPLVELFLTQDVELLQDISPPQALEERLTELEKDVIVRAKHLCTQLEAEKLKVAKLAQVCFSLTATGSKQSLGSAYYKKECLDECLLKASKGAASDAAEYAFTQLKESVTLLSTQGEILHRALQMYPFMEMAEVLAAKILAFQEQEGKVPASKIPAMARAVLEGEYGISAALCRLGNNVHHVLLDEFQDTSREQWEALRPFMVQALSQGGSLTWVGDVKQAIYGWRGGDAALFDAVLHTPELTCMATVSQKNLPTNWRSREQVVLTNNALFTPLAQPEKARPILEAMLSEECPPPVLDTATQKLCAAFMGAGQEVKPDAQGGYVRIDAVQGENSEELNEAVREALQQRLEDLRQRRPWSDITILTRTNTAAGQVAAWLLDWQIPAITENSLLLHTHPLIKESLALLAFLHCPQDDLSFWTVLTGHMVQAALLPEEKAAPPSPQSAESPEDMAGHVVANIRPSLEELHTWILHRRRAAKEGQRLTSLAHAFQEKWPEFWEYTFAPFYGAAQVLTPYDCMQEWYRLWQVPQRFAEAQTFLRRFLEVLHSAEARGAGTLGAFLEYWAQSGGEEKTPTPTKLNAVRIMTMHKSKGLQFPVVIVPWLSFNLRDDYPPMVQKVGDLRVLAPRTKWSEELTNRGEQATGMGYAHYTAQADGALECLNVFYVACTRAQEELHAFHTHTPKLLSRNNLASGLVQLFKQEGMELPLEVGYPIVKEGFEQKQEEPSPPLSQERIAEEDIAQQACPIDFSMEPQRVMQWLPRLKIYRDPLQECLLPQEGEESKQLSPRRRGLLMHHCLETWQSMAPMGRAYATAQNTTQDTGQDIGQTLHTVDTAVQWALQSFALPLGHTAQLQEEMRTALAWYVTLPGVQEWAHTALPEQGLLDVDNALYRVDLLLPPQGAYGWRVVEFKTGQEDAAHSKQLGHYLSLLDAMPMREQGLPPSEGVLIYLDLQKCRMVQGGKVSSLLMAPQWQEA